MKLKTFFGIHVITAIFAVLCTLIFPSGPAPLAKVKFSQSMHVSSGDSIFPIRNKVACVEIIHIFNEEKFLEYLKTNYAYKSGYEMQYDKIKPVVFVEEYIKNTNELFEYLFFCFNGSPKMVLFSSNKRDKEIKSTMFDINWNNLHFNLGGKLHDETILPPKNFDKMIEIAKTLSKGFKFVRVDLHNVDGKIYFGEMTFTPNSGYMKFSNPKWDRIMGDMLNLDD